jgi:hypothetical protein
VYPLARRESRPRRQYVDGRVCGVHEAIHAKHRSDDQDEADCEAGIEPKGTAALRSTIPAVRLSIV